MVVSASTNKVWTKIAIGSYAHVFCHSESDTNSVFYLFKKTNPGQAVEIEKTILVPRQGTHSAKMGTVVWPKIPKMPLHFSAQLVCPFPMKRTKNINYKSFCNIIQSSEVCRSKSLYRSRAGSHFYGTDYVIWTDFGPIGNNNDSNKRSG